MHNNTATRLSPGRKTILAIAVAATLFNGVASAVPVDQIITADTLGVGWQGANLTVQSGVSIAETSGVAVNASGSTLGTLTNNGIITSPETGITNQYAGPGQTIAKIINNLGATIQGDDSAIDLANSGSSIGLIDNKGLISGGLGGSYGQSAIANGGTIGTLSNSGTISSAKTINSSSATYGGIGITNTGTLTTLTNVGLIDSSLIQLGSGYAIAGDGINNTGTLGTLNNQGTISSSVSSTPQGLVIGGSGVSNSGEITTLINSGLITTKIGTGTFGGSAPHGLKNSGILGTLTNDGTISAIGSGATGIYNTGTIDTLTNNRLITGTATGLVNQGSMPSQIGLLTNANNATLSGDQYAIFNNNATIGTLDNSGLISGAVAIQNASQGNITTLNNTLSGTISGGTAIKNDNGTIGVLNNAGLISGSSYAIYSEAPLGAINNSGTIAGDIYSDSGSEMVINGASGSVFGILTGSSAGVGAADIGYISNVGADLRFNSGKLLLNDNIELGSLYSAQNIGATLQINNNIQIVGNYTQAAGAGLLFGVAANAHATGDPLTDNGYGRLAVAGSVTLASGSSVGLTTTGSGYGFAQGQRYLVIGAMDGANSNFNEATLHYTINATGLTLTGENVAIAQTPNANGLVLTVVGGNGSSNAINGASTGDARSSLNGLFNYQGTDPQLMNLARAGAALGSSGSANNGGAQLSPTSTAAAASTASTASTQQVFEVAGNRMDSLRTAQLGNGSSGIATGEAGGLGGGLWGQAFGGSSRQDERDDIAGYHANYHGMLIGADADLNDSWRAGGLFSYSSTSVNNDGANKHNSADIDSYGLIAYATYTANPWYVNLSAGAIQHQYDTKRQVSLTGFDGTAKGNYDGMQYLAAVQAGYPIDLGSKTTLTPIAGLTYSTLKQDSYTEKEGNGAGLHVNSDDIDSLKSDLGAKLERSFATSYGELIPAAQLTWRHEFRDEGLRSVANFSADVAGETSFSTNGPSAINDTGVLSLGATLVRSNRVSLSAKYTLEAGSGYTANTGNLQARWDF